MRWVSKRYRTWKLHGERVFYVNSRNFNGTEFMEESNTDDRKSSMDYRLLNFQEGVSLSKGDNKLFRPLVHIHVRLDYPKKHCSFKITLLLAFGSMFCKRGE